MSMKTPEEIKIGLEWCVHVDCESMTDECPYFSIHTCSSFLKKDALKYINELEARTSLNTLRDAIYEDAVAHGLWESTDYTVKECIEAARQEGKPADQGEMMRGWAMETIRREVNELEDASADAEAYADELADVIIASLSVAGKLRIDIDAAVRHKMEINRVRPWKHGKEGKK